MEKDGASREADVVDGGYPLWIKTLAAIGAAALLGGILTLFFSVGRRPVSIEVAGHLPVRHPDFLLSVAGNAGVPIGRGGTAQLLDNGDEFFPALLEAIGAARETINFNVYIWEDGEVNRRVRDALLERARAGVEVRILLDAIGSLKAPAGDMDALRAAGAKVSTFRKARFGKLTRFHKRNHRRAIVIDGVLGFTGGMAVGDKWLGDAESEEHWRDSMVRVTGPMAVGLQSAFADVWAHTTGELLAGQRFFPDSATGAGGGGPTPTAADPAGGPATGAPEGAAGPAAAPAVTDISLSVAIRSAPSAEDHPLRLLYVQTFAAAEHRLFVANSYFVPDETLRRVIRERARAGVDVRILVPGEKTDAKPIRQTGHAYYEELMADGVRIYEYEPTMMHAKTVTVDGLFSIVGSANMDIRSKELNHENVLGILDAGFARQLETSFFDDVRKSREMSLEEWRRRGRFKRFMERAAKLFAEQY